MTASPRATGYSGTPLSRKLGIRAGSCILLIASPDHYRDLLSPLPDGVVFAASPGPQVDLAQVFVSRFEDLATHLARLRAALRPDAVIWVSWPKKASGIASTVSEDSVRAVALPLGLVDVKVCAVDATWSALKLVVRRALR